MKTKLSLLILVSIFSSFSNLLYAQNPTIQAILSEVDIDSLVFRAEEISGERGIVLNGVTDTIKTRYKTRSGNELAYRYIINEFDSYGLTTDSLLFGALGKNALATLPGMVYPNKKFIICAHYDDMPNATISPAADDDGSGVAAVLEAARILSQYQFEYTIVFAVWDEEEQGLVGSSAYASLANTNNDSIMGVINMDAIAFDSDNDSAAMIHMSAIANSVAIGVTVDNVNVTYGIGLDLNMTNPGATYSDHASFWNNGFGAVLVIEDWNNDANPHYHTNTDKVMYFNLPYYEKMAKLSIASISTLAVPYATGVITEDEVFLPAQIYPNPSTGMVLVDLKQFMNQVAVEVYDMQGKLVYSHNDKEISNFQMDLSGVNEGVYFVHIHADQHYRTLKLVLNR